MSETGEERMSIATRVAVLLIRFYQLAISPLFPSCCRFTPSCSQYGLIAFKRYGFKKGLKLIWNRFRKCHPGGPYGYDPVP